MPLLIAYLLDLLLGDPIWLPHPVVGMGKWISFWEHRLNHGTHRQLKGAMFACLSVALTFAFTWILLHPTTLFGLFGESSQTSSLGKMANGLSTTLAVLLIFFCLAGHTLRKEVRLVFEALDRSLDEGRRQVGRIVGRDTEQLSAQEVRTAALETLAENLSDGVIAPLFWLLLLGVPGMVTYKMINTMDSMIGYKTPRYKDFGLWAARIDDLVNFFPARLTALFILLASGRLTPGTLRFVLRNARNHASPNSGWPEAALAGILNCRFGGTHNYFGQSFYKPHIGTNPRTLTTADMRRSLRISLRAEVMFILITELIIIIINL